MNQKNQHIAILGGGAAGTSLFVNFVEEAVRTDRTDYHISIIEKTGVFGPGLAYSTDSDVHVLNSPSTQLGIVYPDTLDFWHWLIQHEAIWQPSFPDLTRYDQHTPLPRRLYGLYLREKFKLAYRKAMKAGIDVRLLTDEVIDVEKKSSCYCVSLKNQAPCYVESICLCLGLGKQMNYLHLSHLERYLTFPNWDQEKFSNIPVEATVAILGTRLSGMDVILSLAKKKHRGKMMAFSRTAAMPNVISQHVQYERQFLTKEKLLALSDNGKKTLRFQQLLQLIKKEYAFHEGKPLQLKALLNTNKNPLSKFRYDIMKVSNNVRPWQAVFYATNDVINLAWQLLSPKGKQLFLQHRRIFQSLRIAMPLQNAKQVYQLYRDKQLAFYGGLDQISWQDNKFFIQTRMRESPLIADYLIDAAGLTENVCASSNTLLKNLIKKGFLTIDEFGFVATAPKSMKAVGKAGAGESIYVLGGLAQGTYIAANLMASIVELSHNTAKILLNLSEEA